MLDPLGQAVMPSAQDSDIFRRFMTQCLVVQVVDFQVPFGTTLPTPAALFFDQDSPPVPPVR